MRKLIVIAVVTLCSTSAFAGSIANGIVRNGIVRNGMVANGIVRNSGVANGVEIGATGIHTSAATAVAGRLIVR